MSRITTSSDRAGLFFGLVLVLASTGALLFARVLSEDGWTVAEGMLFVVFLILFSYLAFGFAHAIVGACLRWTMRRRASAAEIPEVAGEGKVAIVMPIYNEPVERVFQGLKATFRSVLDGEEGRHFDLHILSDSNRSGAWLAEERAWLEWVRSEGLEGRVFYRHRVKNHGKKAGNVADFCRERGGAYDFMVVLDADSIMTGPTLWELRRRMLAAPRVALLQTMPRLVGARSLYARLQQFANRLYGPLFMDGLSYWQGSGGNFWGHNAILRIAPFVRECALPELPGPRPFGGPILSHDFVEASLLVAAGWEVRLAPDLEGTYEEGPQSLLDAATRDRRWCQGNMQHALLLGARGLRWRSKVHFINGILGYAASPLWLLLVVLGFPILASEGSAGASSAAKLLLLTALLLFVPKLLCVVDLLFDRSRREGFGGMGKAALGAVLETAFSALFAPINMAFHSRFVVWNLLGKSVGWEAQNRGADGTPLRAAWQAHRWQVVMGALLLGLAWFLGGASALVLASPVIGGLLAGPWVSSWTSRPVQGLRSLLVTPEELDPPQELRQVLEAPMKASPASDDIELLLADPYWNAAHLALLGDDPGRDTQSVEPYLLGAGPAGLTEEERMTLIANPDAVGRLHLELWNRWPDRLSPSWQRVLEGLVSGAEKRVV
ncbi:membrane glycosyltransferase [Haloferula luteola]|uniref:Glucans biosynthesis glucosyltransferase H n=1 Tax=Haloferula luteola TaxID=595692 RepID=A0A840VI27_9BACT|nr:glucans biosynthesis glucosyltransferase MdoH [Haloferula luteola]MBB5352381.1 membrane glycosyltransferase [Haloferula luteola]